MDAEKYLPEIARDLSLDLKKVSEAYKKKDIYLVEDFEIPYLRFKENIGQVEKGTVVFLDRKPEYVRGYPKIRRAMVLEKAIKKHLPGFFQAEEKMDGYNIRTAMINNKVIAITRGGIVCPYTTKHVEKILNKKFFEENENLMLCGEVVGLQNPYQMKSYPEAKDFGYFIFDVRNRKTGAPLKVKEKNRILEKYSLPAIKGVGIYSLKDAKKILRLVRRLGEKKREGVVLKDLEMKKQLKYTANQSTNNDLKYAFKFPFDYGQPFFFRRLIREAFQAYELGLSGKKLEKEASELGKSILIPMVEAVRKIVSGKEVTEDFEILVPNMKFGELFINHLRHLGVKVTVEKIKEEKQGVLIKVKRHYSATNDKIKAYLAGEFCQE